MTAHPSCRAHQTGTAALEFALIAPLFFFLLVVSLAFAVSFYVQGVLQGAAEDGVQAVMQMDRTQYDLPADDTAFQAQASTLARQAVLQSLNGAPQAVRNQIANSNQAIATQVAGNQITTTVIFDYASNPLLPTFGIDIARVKGQASASYW